MAKQQEKLIIITLLKFNSDYIILKEIDNAVCMFFAF